MVVCLFGTPIRDSHSPSMQAERMRIIFVKARLHSNDQVHKERERKQHIVELGDIMASKRRRPRGHQQRRQSQRC
jgi:hypothetical protein